MYFIAGVTHPHSIVVGVQRLSLGSMSRSFTSLTSENLTLFSVLIIDSVLQPRLTMVMAGAAGSSMVAGLL